MLVVLAGYFGVAMLCCDRVEQPFVAPDPRLRDVSRAIASGDYAQPLQITTGIRQLHDVAADLEHAASRELVGLTIACRRKSRRRRFRRPGARNCRNCCGIVSAWRRWALSPAASRTELNNVLVPIILFTDTALQDLPESSASRGDLERVLAAARARQDVVKKILTFSRELGDVTLALVDMRAVIAEGLNLFGALAPQHRIRRDVAEDVPWVRADGTLAVHLVINLCTNAYQAMQGTEGVLTIGLRYHAKSPLAGAGMRRVLGRRHRPWHGSGDGGAHF
jgi:hypothetical protein